MNRSEIAEVRIDTSFGPAVIRFKRNEDYPDWSHWVLHYSNRYQARLSQPLAASDPGDPQEAEREARKTLATWPGIEVR